MVENVPVIIRSMSPDDIVKCMILSDAEGWNQTLNDWKRLVEGPQNRCLVAESENRIIGTVTAMNYSNEVAWIGMVLVDKDFRGRGISKVLLSSLIDLLKSCKSVKLDATPAGQPVYEKFGFRNEYLIHRMTNISGLKRQPSESLKKPESVKVTDIPDISMLDHTIFGAERTYLLNSLLEENSDIAWCLKSLGRIASFSLGRKGRKYLQIGPVVAADMSEAKDLISAVFAEFCNVPIVVDVLSDKTELVQWLNSNGFTHQRHFMRMYLQQNPCPGYVKNNYLICGPEFG